MNRPSRWLALAISSALCAAVGAWLLPRLGRERSLLAFHEIGEVEIEPTDGELLASLDPGATARRTLDAHVAEDWKYFLDYGQVEKIFTLGDGLSMYDPWTYTRPMPFLMRKTRWRSHPDLCWTMRTNGLGLREDHELSATPADLRVLVAGDSHTFGVCSNNESFPNLLEERLRALHPGRTVEVINAGQAGYSFYNYFGTLLRFEAFAPQVFVVAVYGGNDFGEAVYLYHRFRGTKPSQWKRRSLAIRNEALKDAPYAMGQCYNSLFSFAHQPGQLDIARQASIQICKEIDQVCRARGIELVVVHIPAACDCRWTKPHRDVERALAEIDLRPDELEGNRILGADLVRALDESGIATLDMVPIFAEQPAPPYWNEDLHMDVTAHRLIAEALEPFVEARLPH
jgi:lysophospholipase L1-like esterase